jgi:uncharacterized protein
MDVKAEQKLNVLKTELNNLKNLLIAYSGGVDSTFLLKVAKDVLGDNILAVTAVSETYPERERREAEQLAGEIEVRHMCVESNELAVPHFTENTTDRCYHCKRELFAWLKTIAEVEGFTNIADGSTYDDIGDFRPGMRAAQELGIVSPLKDAQLTKPEIRLLSKELDLRTWDKPSFACLSSRFPYGEEITKEKLAMVAQAEETLRSLGIKQSRVRHSEYTARIEVEPDDLDLFFSRITRDTVIKKLKELGYNYVSLDLEGYRTGSMNEVLSH